MEKYSIKKKRKKRRETLPFHNEHVLIAKKFTTVQHVWLFSLLAGACCLLCVVVMSKEKVTSYHTCTFVLDSSE